MSSSHNTGPFPIDREVQVSFIDLPLTYNQPTAAFSLYLQTVMTNHSFLFASRAFEHLKRSLRTLSAHSLDSVVVVDVNAG